MRDAIEWTSEELALLADKAFFPAKARITQKIRLLLEQCHVIFSEELKQWHLLAPPALNLEAVQFVKGEHLEDFPYQYLDFPRYYTRREKFAFRTLFWWGHHVVFALILEGGHLRQYKENMINRYADIADRGVTLCLSHSLWDWHQGPGYTLDITRSRKSQVAAVLADRPFMKLATFVPLIDSVMTSGQLVERGRQAFRAMLPIVTV
ncbi:MAG: hypothetical protein D6704_09320 [Nitrospirae bacterium]|nr:MAG: hypothetical protein D6704_09320 [Nitrospirota bacterium]